MFRIVATLLLAGAMLVASSAPAPAQWGPVTPRSAWMSANLTGTYTNMSAGGTCYIEQSGRQFLFTNENGSQAIFAFTGARRLEIVQGEWDPSVIATVGHDRLGRILIRFDAPKSGRSHVVL